MRMRLARRSVRTVLISVCICCSSAVSGLWPLGLWALGGVSLDPTRHEPGEWVAGPARADVYRDGVEAGIVEQGRQPFIGESKPPVPEPGADPVLIVLAQVEDEHASTRHQDARGLGNGPRGVVRVMQGLR